jgi:hypothetical protein
MKNNIYEEIESYKDNLMADMNEIINEVIRKL